MRILKEYIAKKAFNKRIKEIFADGNPCCEVAYPLKNIHSKPAEENKAHVAFDLLIFDRDVSLGRFPLQESKLLQDVLTDIAQAQESQNLQRVQQEINLGAGADWHHAIVSWIAKDEHLQALSNLTPIIAAGFWLNKKIKELRAKYNGAIRIGPASARTIAISELGKIADVQKIEVLFEHEAVGVKGPDDRDFFIFLRLELTAKNEYGHHPSSYYMARISWEGEVISLIRL